MPSECYKECNIDGGSANGGYVLRRGYTNGSKVKLRVVPIRRVGDGLRNALGFVKVVGLATIGE